MQTSEFDKLLVWIFLPAAPLLSTAADTDKEAMRLKPVRHHLSGPLCSASMAVVSQLLLAAGRLVDPRHYARRLSLSPQAVIWRRPDTMSYIFRCASVQTYSVQVTSK